MEDNSPIKKNFYKRKLYDSFAAATDLPSDENAAGPPVTDAIYCSSSTCMQEVPDESVHLMITSPPYNVGKEYDEDLSIKEYREFLAAVFEEVYKKLVCGGRACINIANVGRKPYIPLHAVIADIMNKTGYLMRGEIIWDKGASVGVSTAWGSWLSAANPVLRDCHEYILIFSKKNFSRKKTPGKKNTISRDDFLQWTKSIWSFPSENAKKIGHPAPFPLELPRRLIHLYSFEGDIILDPFCGSGTTCLAAAQCGRHYIGYDVKQEYVSLALERLSVFSRKSSLS